ncbi:MAG: hypothetical protein U1A72_21950 [Sulfuritalea sp.]|nr:hypothetical protein [Sulfuritalea sp.]
MSMNFSVVLEPRNQVSACELYRLRVADQLLHRVADSIPGMAVDLPQQTSLSLPTEP